ncbi:MAG TPA: PilW family protein [Burkholderiaceae bacterium]|nr:PilW family protein [Burkholderiaceae bacterium]
MALPLRGARAAQHGLTLIELLVTMVISLIVLAAISYAYLGTHGAYRTNEGAARVQESGRFAIDSIARDLRRTGFLGCGSTLTATGKVPPAVMVAPGAAAVSYAGNVGVVSGFTGAWDASAFKVQPFAQPATWIPGTDVLVIRVATSSPVPVQQFTPGGTTFVADGAICSAINPSPSPTLLAISSCTRAALVSVAAGATSPACTAGVPAPGVPTTVTFASAVPVNDVGETALTVDGFLTAQQFDEVAYYVAKNSAGGVSLYRHSAATGASDEVVDGIEGLGLQFGVAAALPPGDAATQMQLAGANAIGPNTGNANWANVVSIEVAVQAVGGDLAGQPGVQGQAGATNGVQAYATPLVPGQGVLAVTDTRLRDRFSTTVALRNRMN